MSDYAHLVYEQRGPVTIITINRPERMNAIGPQTHRVGKLINCVLVGDEIVRMRASDALEKICRQHPDRLTPHIDRVLTDLAAIPSHRYSGTSPR